MDENGSRRWRAAQVPAVSAAEKVRGKAISAKLIYAEDGTTISASFPLGSNQVN